MNYYGILYHDQTGKLSELELIETARRAFERRCSEKANIALLNFRSTPPPEIPGILVTFTHLVWPHYALVGVTLPEDDHSRAKKLARNQ